jgi:hypothetical protein
VNLRDVMRLLPDPLLRGLRSVQPNRSIRHPVLRYVCSLTFLVLKLSGAFSVNQKDNAMTP